jgi:hypothetical protein
MKLRSLVLALAVAAGCSAVASAQGALYITPVADRIAISKADPGLYSFLGPNTTSRLFYGVQFGGFYDVPLNLQQAEIGLDLRDSVLHGNNALINSFLVGPRIAPVLANHPRIHPYVEPFIGVGTTRAPNTAIKVTKPQYGVFVGADLNLSHVVSWRVAEIGYSGLSTASGSTIGVTESIPSATLLTITTGLTFRLP